MVGRGLPVGRERFGSHPFVRMGIVSQLETIHGVPTPLHPTRRNRRILGRFEPLLQTLEKKPDLVPALTSKFSPVKDYTPYSYAFDRTPFRLADKKVIIFDLNNTLVTDGLFQPGY